MPSSANTSTFGDRSPHVEPAARGAPYEAALQYLAGRIDYERARNIPYQARKLKLQRMRQLLARLGDPQTGLPIVHIAGTKGKGSTAAMVGAVLRAAGYRTAVFTSPHLTSIEERFQVDSRPCTADELVELVDAIRPTIEAMDRELIAAGRSALDGPTYFEITTAMALLHCRRRQADVAVLEVGLGGRLDSTNVCQACVSVITSISYDHTRQLGNTLEAIAREKAGIIKPGVPVVSGVLASGPAGVIREVCQQQGAPLRQLGRDFTFRYHPPRHLETAPAAGLLDFAIHRSGGGRTRERYALGLCGAHQASNAAVALAVLDELARSGWRVSREACRAGLAEVAWPARAEVIARHPAIVLDVAHNVASIEALLAFLRESFSVRRRLLVFATTEEKDAAGMLARLLGHFDEVFFTRYQNNPRGIPPERLHALAVELTGRHCPTFAQPSDAWRAVRARATPDDLICVTGSFFIAGEMRQQIAAQPWSPGP